jgi:hypothetical protein
MPCVLGQALSLQARHGGKAQHAKLDAPKMAAVRRGGRRPHADGYAAAMRATRALLRRRRQRRRHRAALWAHGPQPHRPSTLPESGQTLASQAKRRGGAERVADPAGPPRIAVACALSTYDAARRSGLAWSSVQRATPPEATTGYRRRALPGVGKLLALVRRDDLHASRRLPRGQDLVSSGRLVKCAKASAGKRDGPSGPKSGHASRKGAFAAAAVRFLRHHPAGQKWRARFANTPDKGKALTSLAHPRARAVSSRLTRATVLARNPSLHQ